MRSVGFDYGLALRGPVGAQELEYVTVERVSGIRDAVGRRGRMPAAVLEHVVMVDTKDTGLSSSLRSLYSIPPPGARCRSLECWVGTSKGPAD